MRTGLGSILRKKAPSILAWTGVIGMGVTVVLAVKATPKAMKLLEEKRAEQDEELTKMEVVKTAWPCYIPAIISGSLTATSIVTSNSMNHKRQAIVESAYELTETTLHAYQQKVKEVLGEKKEKELRDEIAISKMREKPFNNAEVIFTSKGETLCYDTLSNRYFRSDIDTIKKIVNDLNKRLRTEMYISLNDFYMEVGLRPTQNGDDLGWNIDEYIEPSFSYGPAEDGTPCLILGYRIAPRYDYRVLV